MLARTSGKSGGSGQLRRSLVLRFLAGCHENEMFLFVEMAFKIYTKYMNGKLLCNIYSIYYQ
jgi:U3 small nucleolar RNA-associated protein 20